MGVGSDLRKTIYKQTKEIAIAIGELPCSIEELDRTEADELNKLQNKNAKLRELVGDMQSFWHRMADEEPNDEKGEYLLLDKYGAMYIANGFHTWEYNQRKSFYIPNNRNGYMDFDKIKAWAVIPEMEEDK